MQRILHHRLFSYQSFFFALLLLLSSCQNKLAPTAAAQAETWRPIIDSVQTWVEKERFPGMAIGIIQEGEVVFMDAFGWADKENGIEATPQTIYGLGSMSKSICATGVMTLVQDERIKLEDAVNPIITPLRLTGHAANADLVKVWHVLNMSAGIPHGWTSYADGSIPQENLEAEALFNRYALVTFPPGEVHHYANYSMGVGDVIIEKATQKRLNDYMQASLFLPLGMKNSLVTYQDKKAGQQLALPYSSRMELMDSYQFFPYGGGGYYSSVEDLLNYAKFHLKVDASKYKEVLTEENIELLHNFNQGPSELFKLGWFNDGVKLVSNGNISGYNSCLVLIPERDLGVVVLTNFSSRNSIADQIAFSLVDSLAQDLPEGMNREKYAALYETPYQQNEVLLGTWEGFVITQKDTIPVTLVCGEEIELKVGEASPVQVQNPIFDQDGKLSGNFESRIPIPEFSGNRAVNTWLSLYLDGNRLLGNAMPIINNDKGSFSYGAYIELSRRNGNKK